MNEEQVAKELGCFSLALGLTEVLATENLTGYLGMEKQAGLVNFYGFREITAGLGLLAQPRPAGWLWSRVAGDALDIAALAAALGEENPKRNRVAVALALVLGITAIDIACAQKMSRAG